MPTFTSCPGFLPSSCEREPMRRIALFLLMLMLQPALAQDRSELAENNPVAIVALTQGQTEIKHVDGEWRPIYWMDLLRPEDQIRTAEDGKVVVTFFHDDHQEVVDPNTEGRTKFREITKTSDQGEIRKTRPLDRSVSEIPIPYMLMRRLYREEFKQADEADALEKEKVFLAAYVKAEAYPPVFIWKEEAGPTPYKFQMFNEWDEFLYENKTNDRRFKYPYRGPFNMQKNSLYRWQVTDAQDNIVVRKYAFVLLTLPHSREIARREKVFNQAKDDGKLMKNDYVDLFLLYNQRKMIDKSLHLLQQMSEMDPENPVIYRALVRAYLAKGCPAHALQAHERELQLGGTDPIKE